MRPLPREYTVHGPPRGFELVFLEIGRMALEILLAAFGKCEGRYIVACAVEWSACVWSVYDKLVQRSSFHM